MSPTNEPELGPGSRTAARIAEYLEHWADGFPVSDFHITHEWITRPPSGRETAEVDDYFLFRASPRTGAEAHELGVSRMFLSLALGDDVTSRLAGGIQRARANPGKRFLVETLWMFAHEIPRRPG